MFTLCHLQVLDVLACLDSNATADVEGLCKGLSFLSNALARIGEVNTPRMCIAIRECDLGPLACYLATAATSQERRTFGKLFGMLIKGFSPVSLGPSTSISTASPGSKLRSQATHSFKSNLTRQGSLKNIVRSSTSQLLPRTTDDVSSLIRDDVPDDVSRLIHEASPTSKSPPFATLVSAANTANGKGLHGMPTVDTLGTGDTLHQAASTPSLSTTGTVTVRLRSTLFTTGHFSDSESTTLRASICGYLHSCGCVSDSKAEELVVDLQFPSPEALLLQVIISGKDVDGALVAKQLEVAFRAKKWTRVFGVKYVSVRTLLHCLFRPSRGGHGCQEVPSEFCAGTCTPSSRPSVMPTQPQALQRTVRPIGRGRQRLASGWGHGAHPKVQLGGMDCLQQQFSLLTHRSTLAWHVCKTRWLDGHGP
jgi:hypothetical protein